MADNEHGIFPIGGTENPNRSLDVIFVHGLGGDARTTWEDGDAFWPKWLSEDFPNIGIWTIGYGADRSRWVNDVMSMEDRGLNLLNHLSIKNIGEKPILFIAHSMGGLISKHLLEQGRNNSTEDYRRIVENTVGVIFIATPHSGSGWADALDALPLYRGNRVIDGLKKDEPALRRLSNAFTELVKAKSLKCLCFFETKEIRVKNKWFGWKGIQIVSENSASGNFPKEKSPVGLDDDHLSICRLKSRESQLYGNVAKFIRESLTENTLTKPAVSLDKSTTKPVETSDTQPSQKSPDLPQQPLTQNAANPQQARNTTGNKKVFISYSHDSQPHRDFVRGIANRLRSDGLECQIDQFINGSPPEGWQRWMEDRVEEADFVLMVCTPTYLKRYRGKEDDGSGKGVTFEGVVISQTLYDAYYKNTKFVPVIPANGNIENVPLPLKAYSTYKLPDDYDALYRYLTGQAEHIAQPVGQQRVMPPTQDTPDNDSGTEEIPEPPPAHKIQITKLPHTNSHLFGRKTELTMLDNAWADGINILTLKAMGGTGKTSLLKHWLDQFVADGYRGAQAVFTWSFYSQGSAESKQVSTDDFFEAALRFFGYTEEKLPAPHDRGIQLARLVAAQRALLILDGLEPLQHPVGTLRGELKDQGLKALLQQLAISNAGLCLISSRQTVEELKGKAESLVLAHDLEHLQVKDGVQLLQHIGVNGPETELTKAVTEVAGHALALNLLGNYVKTVLSGDIRQRDKIPGLMAERHDGQHAQKMLAAYEAHLQGTTALSVLYLMGLFDRPVSPGAIQCLQQANIPGLTDSLGSKADWCYTIENLREQKLLNAINPDYPDNLDCHPLIREYFAQQLQSEYPKAWQQAHACLYAYYKDLPEKELPDTLEEMQPLFSAVAHGCAAGLHQQALEEIYWPRVRRKGEHYISKKLGAFNNDLATLAHFFTKPWQEVAQDLAVHDVAALLNFTGSTLYALGRLSEAMSLMQASLNSAVKQQKWRDAATSASSLSDMNLNHGSITNAISILEQSVIYADKSDDPYKSVVHRAAHAGALHQSGYFALALKLFQEAESEQEKYEPRADSRLYSIWGYHYCDLLLSSHKNSEKQNIAILDRAKYSFGISTRHNDLLSVSLDKLILGRVHLQLSLITPLYFIDKAKIWLNLAVMDLRSYGSQQHLPRGLLARAALFRHDHDYDLARQDLQEVFGIANFSGMRLHLTDYHLEMARVLLEEEKVLKQNTLPQKGTVQYHIGEATRLINETGYHRRDQELLELQQAAKDPYRRL